MKKHLLILDGLNIIRRVYGANPAPDSETKAQGALKASISSIRRALSEHSPSHAALLMDVEGPTWRHAILDTYKIYRKPMPDVLRQALKLFDVTLLQATGIKTFRHLGVEADDLAGELSIRFTESDPAAQVTILSTDKDVAQFGAMERVSVYNHFDSLWHDTVWCQNKFGIKLEQLGDFLALQGDATDNIPGVTKVGPTIASRLLQEYETLDNVLANAHTFKGKLGKTLQDPAEQANARLSRQLVGFRLDTGIFSNLEDLRLANVS